MEQGERMYRPLADELRPENLRQVVGQGHILKKGGLLSRIVDSGQIPNMIFYGPSGTGKTTVAQIIARRTNRTLRRLNATTAGITDIKAIIGELDTMLTPGGVLLYLDEIQYFNKKQQQSLLEFIENGKITLIASTTENPYFYIFNAVLSRSTVFEFKHVQAEDIAVAINRAVDYLKVRDGIDVVPEHGVVQHIASSCGGDVRKAVNAVEFLYNAGVHETGRVILGLEDAYAVSQKSAMRYDREGDAHYDILSALQKSIRGSDPNAALHYLARLLEAGDLVSPCRRILVTAAEDIGLAYPMAIPIVKACIDSAVQVGLPEAQIPLGDAVILLATAPKSNSGCEGIHRAMADVRAGKTGDFPRHLQNVHADSTGQEREQNYKYPHAYPGGYVRQQYLPDVLKDARYYEYGDNKVEQAARKYWDAVINQQGGNRD